MKGTKATVSQHADGSVRHAEKRRIGTCQFADRIARVSIDEYKKCIPKEWRDSNPQICLATIVAHFPSSLKNANHDKVGNTITGVESGISCNVSTTTTTAKNDNNTSCNIDMDTCSKNQESDDTESYGYLQVMALGIGTKFVSEDILRHDTQLAYSSKTSFTKSEDIHDESSIPLSYGMRIRDAHAEILCRRAFRRQLTLEMISLLEEKSIGDTHDGIHQYQPVLKLSQSSTSTLLSNNEEKSSPCFDLVDDQVTFHFYSSSAPCGNATLKKFVKMSKEKWQPQLGPDEWFQETHTTEPGHSIRLGQLALLVKKDSTCTVIDSSNELKRNHDEVSSSTKPEIMDKRKQKKSKVWPATTNDQWCPPGTSITQFNKGSIHTCSDKLCRWNCIGIQGSLLASVLRKPLFITSLTVGRKFTRVICQRAICCRVGEYTLNGEGRNKHMKNIQTLEQNKSIDQEKLKAYYLHHPSIMGTAVYLDESGVLDMSGEKMIGQDVRFISSTCWIYWPFCAQPESIDGETGFIQKTNDESCTSTEDDDIKQQRISRMVVSKVSTFSLTELFFQLSNLLCRNDNRMETYEYNTIQGIRQLKRILSPDYEFAKDALVMNRIFAQWRRREKEYPVVFEDAQFTV